MRPENRPRTCADIPSLRGWHSSSRNGVHARTACGATRSAMDGSKDHLGLQDLDDTNTIALREVLAVGSDQAAHLDELIGMARAWLYEQRILIPGARRLADWAREAFAAAETRTRRSEFSRPVLQQPASWSIEFARRGSRQRSGIRRDRNPVSASIRVSSSQSCG